MEIKYLFFALCILYPSLDYAHAGAQHYHYKSRMGRAERLLRTYMESAPYDDLILFRNVLSDYPSWYLERGCDEASRICTRLSDDARELVRNIQYYAKSHMPRKRSRREVIPPSPDIDAYYQELLEIVDQYLESAKPCGTECRVPVEV